MTESKYEIKKQLLACARRYEFCEFGMYVRWVSRNAEWMTELKEVDSIDNVLMELFQKAHGREYPHPFQKILLEMYGVERDT